MTGRLKSIDLLRGAAALAVVFHHVMYYGRHREITAGWFEWLKAIGVEGSLGVPLFFVISGFCIHLPWAREARACDGRPRPRFLAFWKRRFWRLYPPYIAVVLLSTTLLFVALLKGNFGPLKQYPEPTSGWILRDLLSHVFMLHGFSPVFDRGAGNPPLWSLAREEYLYLLYFAILFWRRRFSLAAGVPIVVAVGLAFELLMRLVLPEQSDYWTVVHSSALTLWIQWYLGAVSAESFAGLVRLPRVFSLGLLVPVWAAGALAADERLPLAAPVLWGLTFFTLVNSCVRRETEGRWPKLALTGWLERVGIFSYSLYLIHCPALNVAKQALGPLKATTSPYLYVVAALALGVASYFAAKVFFLLVEARFLARREPVKAGAL